MPRLDRRRLVAALGGYKLGLIALALLTPLLLPGVFSVDAWVGNFHWPPDRGPDAFSALETWDAQHYLYLAEEGYARRRMPIAFFPLFPWLIRAVALLPGIGPLGAAMVVSNGCSLAAAILLFAVLRRRHPGTQWPALLLLFSFPGAFFFQLPYTESLFLLLAVVAFLGFETERYDLVAGAAFLLALTRPNGILFALAIAWDLYRCWRQGRRIGGREMAALLAPVLGFGAYLLAMRLATGDAMAGLEMQRAFHANRSISNLWDLPLLFRNLVDVRVIHGISFSLLDRLAFLLVAATLLPLWRLDRLLFWFTLPMALIGPLSGSFVSYVRFAAVLFPCFVVLGTVLGQAGRRPWLIGTTVLFFTVQVILLLRHTTFRWAG